MLSHAKLSVEGSILDDSLDIEIILELQSFLVIPVDFHTGSTGSSSFDILVFLHLHLDTSNDPGPHSDQREFIL